MTNVGDVVITVIIITVIIPLFLISVGIISRIWYDGLCFGWKFGGKILK